MIRTFLLFTTAIFSIFAIENIAAQKFITGKVTHVGPTNINENVQVEISLRDVSLMDVASKLIASITISNPRTFPISYQLEYNPLEIKAGFTYALSARITGSSNQLLYINDVRTVAPLIETPSPNVDIAVIRVGGSSGSNTPKVDSTTVCPPVLCLIACPYGFEKKDGCEICQCYDPCNPFGKAKCSTGQQCSVERNPDGTFAARCETVSKKRKCHKGVHSRCNLPKVVGPCKARIPRYYYNSTNKSCELFYYGGCQGNRNNFATIAACETACKT